MIKGSIETHRINYYRYWAEIEGKRYDFVDVDRRHKYFYWKQRSVDILEYLLGIIAVVSALTLIGIVGRLEFLDVIGSVDNWPVGQYIRIALISIILIAGSVCGISKIERR